MANTIITKNSATASAVPTSGQLVQGELAVNVTDKRLFTEDSGGTVVEVGTNPSTMAVAGNATVGGTLTSGTVDINGGAIDGTTIGASSASTGSFTNLTATGTVTIPDNAISGDKVEGGTINAITINTLSSNPTLSGGTANGVTYLNGSKVLTSGSALTFDGNNLGLNGISNPVGSSMTSFNVAGTTYGTFYASANSEAVRGTFNATSADNTVNIRSLTNHPLVFGVNDNEAMRLTSTGLGIGTSSPAQKLDVYGNGMKVNNASYTGYIGADSVFGSSGVASSFTVRSDNALTFSTGGPYTRATIDSSGNLGLGVTPSAWNTSFYTAAQVGAGASVFGSKSNASVAWLNTNSFFNSSNNQIYIANGFATQYRQLDGQHAWFTAPSGTAGNAISFTQAMTLDASGNLLVGTTSNPNSAAYLGMIVDGNAKWGRATQMANSTGVNAEVFFNNSGTVVGSINISTTATAYNTSSDYRLKEDWQPMTGASERVKALKPVNFAWKADGSRVDGFLAHEAQAVVPEAVTGEKDAVDAEGKPKYQGIDQSKLVPLLTAALQEALAKIESLEARLDAANL